MTKNLTITIAGKVSNCRGVPVAVGHTKPPFGVTNLSVKDYSPEYLMKLIRQHWHIDNRLQDIRDVTFHKDACQIREHKRQC